MVPLTAMDLSVIIVNYRMRGMLAQCLRGIERLHLSITHEVIVVDNASRDGSIEMVRERFPSVRLIANARNKGLAVANNLGIRAASGTYLLLLNPDIAVLDGSIEVLVHFLASHDDVGLVGPRLLNPDRTTQAACYRFPTPWIPIFRRTPFGRLPAARRKLRHYLMLDWDHRTNRPVDWVLGAAMLIKRRALDDVGLMDERFFLYFEDVDLCRRMWRANWKVLYVADAVMVHYHQRLSAEHPGFRGVFTRATRIHIASGIRYFLKYRRIHEPFLTSY